MWIFSVPYFPVYLANRIRIFPNMDRIVVSYREKCGYDSAHTRENTIQRKSAFWDTSGNVK